MDDHNHELHLANLEIGRRIREAKEADQSTIRLDDETLSDWYDAIEYGTSTKLDILKSDFEECLSLIEDDQSDSIVLHIEQLHEWHDMMERHLGCELSTEMEMEMEM